jgi:hypothetical protein
MNRLMLILVVDPSADPDLERLEGKGQPKDRLVGPPKFYCLANQNVYYPG